MDQISDIKIVECVDSLFIKPSRMHFKQNGKPRIWDLTTIHDSVAIILYNKTRNVLICVKQFRPAVYYNSVPHEGDTVNTAAYPAEKGITLELCAGIIDKKISLAEIAREEILEECGYDVPINGLEKVTSFRSSVGESGSLQTLFYAEVTDEMHVGEGGGIASEGEYIQVVEFTLAEMRKVIYDESIPRPASFLFALMWYFENRAPKAI